MGVAKLKLAITKSYDVRPTDFALGYVWAIAASSVVYLGCNILRIMALNGSVTLPPMFFFVAGFELIFGGIPAFILMLVPWVVVVLIGRRVRCCNLPYFVLAGTILIFSADMFTSLGVISLFDYGYVSPSDQLRWQLHSQGLSYIAMGMAFGLAFWSMLAWRRTYVRYRAAG
jgi:hypothetical protein